MYHCWDSVQFGMSRVGYSCKNLWMKSIAAWSWRMFRTRQLIQSSCACSMTHFWTLISVLKLNAKLSGSQAKAMLLMAISMVGSCSYLIWNFSIAVLFWDTPWALLQIILMNEGVKPHQVGTANVPTEEDWDALINYCRDQLQWQWILLGVCYSHGCGFVSCAIHVCVGRYELFFEKSVQTK